MSSKSAAPRARAPRTVRTRRAAASLAAVAIVGGATTAAAQTASATASDTTTGSTSSSTSSTSTTSSAASTRYSGTITVYGISPSNQLTRVTIDAATGKASVTLTSGSYTLPFAPRSIATVDDDTVLAVSTSNELWRIDVNDDTGWVAVGGEARLATGVTDAVITVDGSGHLYGSGGGALHSYTLTSSGSGKPVKVSAATTVATGVTLTTLTSEASGWVTGTTADGRLVSYQISDSGTATQFTLRSRGWAVDALTSAGDGYLLSLKDDTLTAYRDGSTSDGSGTDLVKTTQVTTGVTATLLSAEPAAATLPNVADLSTTGICPLGASSTGVDCNQAIGFMVAQMYSGSTAWHNRCLNIVSIAYGGAFSGYPSAMSAARAIEANGHLYQTTDFSTIPRGAIVWLTNSTGAGHVVISVGGGLAISSDIANDTVGTSGGGVGVVPISYFVDTWGQTFLGWSAPSI